MPCSTPLEATTAWPSPAKINLFLYVTGRRPDGYHCLQTLFQFLDYSDTLFFTLNSSGEARLLTPMAGIANKDNLIVRAALSLMQLAKREKNLPPYAGVDIRIEKVLPQGGGLGGGSSNAATVLVALNHLWQLQFNQAELSKLGLSLGADVPIFILGHSAFAEGIGEKLTPVCLKEKWYLIAHPNIRIPTEQVFADPLLVRNTPPRPLTQLLNSPFTNNCELVVKKRFPKVDAILSWLIQYAPSRLTGTGACVFAEFDTEANAQRVLASSPTWLSGFVAKGSNLSPLYSALSERVNSAVEHRG